MEPHKLSNFCRVKEAVNRIQKNYKNHKKNCHQLHIGLNSISRIEIEFKTPRFQINKHNKIGLCIGTKGPQRDRPEKTLH